MLFALILNCSLAHGFASTIPDLNAIRISPKPAVKSADVSDSDVSCPQDFQFDQDFKLCRGTIKGLEDEFVVPRTSSLRVACELLGLGKFCKTYKVWPKSIVEKLRGPQSCPIGSGWDSENKVCRDMERVYGPFLWSQTDSCERKKCGGSCASSDWGSACLVPKTASVDPALPIKVSGSTWKPEWSAFMHQTIMNKAFNLTGDDQRIAASVQNLCPLYGSMSAAQRASFWTVAMASMSFYESGFNPRTRFFEPPPLSKYSEGLFQLSVDDGGHGPSCDFLGNGRDILSPYHNIDCAVDVMDRQMRAKREFFTPGYFYYWSVLRKRIPEIRSLIRDAQDRLPFCYQSQPEAKIDWFDASDNYRNDLKSASFSCQTKRFNIFAVDKPNGSRYLAFKRSAPNELALSLMGAKVDDEFYLFGKQQFTYVLHLKNPQRLEVYQDEEFLFQEACLDSVDL